MLIGPIERVVVGFAGCDSAQQKQYAEIGKYGEYDNHCLNFYFRKLCKGKYFCA
jgi:hypothetical protein